jgi:hypothetical protein
MTAELLAADADSAEATAVARIEHTAAGFSLSLEILREGERPKTRELSAPRCEPLAKVTALIAMAVDPLAVAERLPSPTTTPEPIVPEPPADPTADPTASDPSDDPLTRSRPRAPACRTAAPSRPRACRPRVRVDP